jgi:flagellar biosynthesis/type III secretory pathway protein FliH
MNTFRVPAIPRTLQARWVPLLEEIPAFDQGYSKGYSEGWAKAQVDSKAQMEERIQASRAHWDAVTSTLNEFPREIAQKLREQLVGLAFSTVHKILAATPIQKEEVAAQVTQMLGHVEAATEIEIQLNPEDLALMTEDDRIALWNEDLTHLKWTANPSVPRGGCVLHGEFGWMDGRWETRLAKLEQLALESVREGNT